MFYEILLPVLIVVGMLSFFFVIIIAACLWEKRPIQTYYVPKKGEAYTPNQKTDKANRQAKSLGYRYCGLCHDGKGKLYRVRYDFWLSPDLMTFANVGSGTVAKIPVNGVWLYSLARDGRTLCTTNEIGEQDISGAEEQLTWPQMEFHNLAQKHDQRLEGNVCEPFESDTPLAMYFDIRRRKADALVSRNYAHYLDDEQTVWRYTLKGALVFYVITIWVRPIMRGFRHLSPARSQRS